MTGITGGDIGSDILFHIFPFNGRDHSIVCLIATWVAHEQGVVKEANKFAAKFMVVGNGNGEGIGWEIVAVEEELDGRWKGKDFTGDE